MSGSVRAFGGGLWVYQALYRKWRPRTFADVAGQPQIVSTLQNELKAGRVAHAYLFTGSRGTGKTTCAKILAKAVNCLQPVDGGPCGVCAICKGIDDGSVTDVAEIDAASNNGVDSIRALREETVYTPAAAKYRVYIIDEAHMLSAGAWNALLKTLEEPPAYVIFILATTEAHKIPATILSRCQRFDFRRIPPAEIADRLLYVAGEEQIPLTQDGASAIARLADGALRDALSILDTCAGTGQPVDGQAVDAAMGLAGQEHLFALSDAVLAQDAPAALAVLDGLYASSKDPDRLCEELTLHFRAVMRAQAGSPLPAPSAWEGRLLQAAKDFAPAAVLAALDTLSRTAEALRRAPVKRVEMELCLLKLCNPALNDSPAALLARMDALERRLNDLPRGLARQAPAPAGHPAGETARREQAYPAASAAEGEASARPPRRQERAKPAEPAEEAPQEPAESTEPDRPLDCWPEVLEELARLDPPLRGVLDKSRAVLRGALVLVDSGNAMFATLIRQPAHQKPLVEAVRAAAGKPYKVGVFKSALRAAQPKPKADDPFDALLRAAKDGGIPIEEQDTGPDTDRS